MVNRGADISWLSQYPHEKEILFGPLTGIEVLDTRIDGTVVEIICDFSINLTALTLEQVLGKRRALIDQMAVQQAEVVRRRLEVRRPRSYKPLLLAPFLGPRPLQYRSDPPA